MTHLWSHPGVPQKGWSCIEVIDLEDAVHTCQMCGLRQPVASSSLQRVHDVPEASKHQDEEHSVGEDFQHQHLPNCARNDFLPIRAPREGFRGRRSGSVEVRAAPSLMPAP